jgi:uncharacterized protein YjbJ (UPF0337 family)
MNQETIQGNWNEIKGQIKEKWGKLTDDDLAKIHGEKDQLVGALQQKYGLSKEEAEKRVGELESACGCSSCKPC